MSGTTDLLMQTLTEAPPASRAAALDVIARVLLDQADTETSVVVQLHEVPRPTFDRFLGESREHVLQPVTDDGEQTVFWSKQPLQVGSPLPGHGGGARLALFTHEPPPGWTPPARDDEDDEGGEAA